MNKSLIFMICLKKILILTAKKIGHFFLIFFLYHLWVHFFGVHFLLAQEYFQTYSKKEQSGKRPEKETLKKIKATSHQVQFFIPDPHKDPSLKIFTESFLSENQKKNPKENMAFVFVQGRNEFTEMYHELANKLLEKYHHNVHLFDLRGQGKSSGYRCYVSSFEDYTSDLKSYLHYLKSTYHYTSIHLIAHSTGALISTFVAAQSPELLGPQGTLALASPLFGIPLSPIVRFIGGHLSFLLSQTYITATLSAKKKICPSFEENDLTNDSYFYQNFFDHPLKCGPPTWGWVHAINHALQQLPQTITRLKHPTLIMYSHDDKVVDPEETQRMISKLQEQKKPPLMEEGFFNMKHVLFHDKNRSKVFQRLYRFYDTSKFISDKKRSRR